jgi:ankyrin repeat protein
LDNKVLTIIFCAGIERKILKNAVDIILKEVSIILYLLARKANVNSRDNFGCTPLHYAASKCNGTAVMQLLTDKNVDLEVCGLTLTCNFGKLDKLDSSFARPSQGSQEV